MAESREHPAARTTKIGSGQGIEARGSGEPRVEASLGATAAPGASSAAHTEPPLCEKCGERHYARRQPFSAAYTVLESIRDLADYESESDDGHWAIRKLEAIWALADDALVNREDEARV